MLDFRIRMGACNDPKIRIEFLRSLENRTGFKALGNGDQQCAGLFNPGSFQCSLIERIARQHTNVVVFRSAGHVGLVFDYNEGLSSLLQFSSDQTAQIGRAHVVKGKSVSVRVDLGGRRILKKKKKKK